MLELIIWQLANQNPLYSHVTRKKVKRSERGVFNRHPGSSPPARTLCSSSLCTTTSYNHRVLPFQISFSGFICPVFSLSFSAKFEIRIFWYDSWCFQVSFNWVYFKPGVLLVVYSLLKFHNPRAKLFCLITFVLSFQPLLTISLGVGVCTAKGIWTLPPNFKTSYSECSLNTSPLLCVTDRLIPYITLHRFLRI